MFYILLSLKQLREKKSLSESQTFRLALGNSSLNCFNDSGKNHVFEILNLKILLQILSFEKLFRACEILNHSSP